MSSLGFKDDVEGKLYYVRHWKDNLEMSIRVMNEADKNFELVEISGGNKTRGRAKHKEPNRSLWSMSPKSRDEAKKNEGDHSENPAAC